MVKILCSIVYPILHNSRQSSKLLPAVYELCFHYRQLPSCDNETLRLGTKLTITEKTGEIVLTKTNLAIFSQNCNILLVTYSETLST